MFALDVISFPFGTDAATGYLPEAAHPYEVLKGKVNITWASPKGGEVSTAP
jgi:hypothetical protein